MRALLAATLLLAACGGKVVVDAEPTTTSPPPGDAGSKPAEECDAGGCAWTPENWTQEDTCCRRPDLPGGGGGCEFMMIPDCITGTLRCGCECATEDVCWSGKGTGCRVESPSPEHDDKVVICPVGSYDGGAECTRSQHNGCCISGETCWWVQIPGCAYAPERCGAECVIREECWNGVENGYVCHAEPIPGEPGAKEMVCAWPNPPPP